MSQPAGPTAAATPAANPRLLWMVGMALVVGVLASLGAVAFITVEHEVQHVLWDVLPETFGWTDVASWWVLAVLLLGAVLTWGALRLPGRGGHTPLHELSFDIGPRQITSVVLAALASLSFGAVLGPEAPLLAISTAIATFALVRARAGEGEILLAAAAMAGMGFILGNPLVTALLLLETAVLRGGRGGRDAVNSLLPALAALGAGYLLQIGFAGWPGLADEQLSVPALPEYPGVRLVDLLIGLPLALAVALIAVAAIWLGETYQRARLAALPKLMIAGAAIAAVALAAQGITGEPVDAVLFSGQSYMAEATMIGSVGTLLVLVAAKAVAYGISIGSGFRGGLIFPGVYLGVLLGTAAAVWISPGSQAMYVATGIAAAVAASLRLPFSAVLLATLLCAGAGLAVTEGAIIGAIVGLLARAALDRLSPVPPDAPEMAEPRGASR